MNRARAATVHNLAGIVAEGILLSDAAMIERGGPPQAVGMSAIKRRRVEELEVSCHPGTKVGDYVPFYFCPRSVMLFVIYCANHPELTYRGGQEPIVHLETDLHAVVAWANANGARWAFSLSNAGARYTLGFPWWRPQLRRTGGKPSLPSTPSACVPGERHTSSGSPWLTNPERVRTR